MRKFIGLIISLVLTAALSTAAEASSTLDTYGASAQGIAMGNAMTSIVHDWSSVFYNIAGLGRSTYKSSDSPITEGKKTMALTKRSGGESSSGAIDDRIYKSELYLGYLYTYPMFEPECRALVVRGVVALTLYQPHAWLSLVVGGNNEP